MALHAARKWLFTLARIARTLRAVIPSSVFAGDHGEFYGDDMDDDKPIKVVFRWTRLGPDAAHWEQAFSLDGKSWETNWTIDHTRVKGSS